MDIRVMPRQIEQFRAPKRTLGDLDADAASRLLAAASDIALIVDQKGVVRDVAFGSEDLSREGFESWIGQRWVDTVTLESREKIVDMLREAATKSAPRWRHVNHPSSRGSVDVPVRYSAVQLPSNGRVVVVGRDLRSIAALQQKLVDAQQSMEREYARLRHAETRYRLLFQISSESVLIVDATSQRIIEANPASAEIVGRPLKKITGRPFNELFSNESQKKLAAHFASAAATGKADETRLKLDTGLEVLLNGSLYRYETSTHYLVRLTPAQAGASALLKTKSSLMEVIQKLPDGFVVTSSEGRILTANTAFLELAQAATEEQVRDEPLGRWLGRHGVDMAVLTKNLKDRGEIRNFATVVRGEFGSTEDVEVSAVAVSNTENPCFGFTVRSVARRVIPMVTSSRRANPRSVEQLTELVGRVSLKELVRESTDMIERLCIEAALELTGDNRASAAEMLGLSRQGLYSKLRRHGIGDLGPDDDA